MTPSLPIFHNLILSGGAFKASAFIGCLKYLEENDMLKNINNVIASSAGSIIGFLFCAGLDMKMLAAFMKKGIQKYVEKEIEIDDVLDIFDTLGIDDGKIFTDLAAEILTSRYKKKDITFVDFAKVTGKNLVILGSNISLAKTEYFSVDTTPLMSVITALRISISIPFVMKPVVMNNMFYIDASLFNNFPIEYFDNSERPFQDTIALYLQCNLAEPNTKDVNLFKYMRIIFDAMFVKLNEKQKPLGKNNIVIEMNFPDDSYGFDINTLKLIMDEKSMHKYIDLGYNSIKDKLESTRSTKQM